MNSNRGQPYRFNTAGVKYGNKNFKRIIKMAISKSSYTDKTDCDPADMSDCFISSLVTG